MTTLRFLPLALLLAVFFVIPLTQQFFQWGLTLSGLCSYIGAGCVLLLLSYRQRWWWMAPLLLLWVASNIGARELVDAVGRMPELADTAYLTDLDFMLNSTGGSGLKHPLFALLMSVFALAALLANALIRRKLQPRLSHHSWWLVLLCFVGHSIAVRHEPALPAWQQYTVTHKLGAEQLSKLRNARRDRAAAAWAGTAAMEYLSADLNGQRLLPDGPGKAKNVLIVTVEGLTGAYIPAAREALGYQYHGLNMDELAEFANVEKAMLTPDYTVHNHQTIRGLYSMLCGDYPKLDGSTPKAVELLASTSDRQQFCLPAQLAKAGFDTHFVQAADLVFMSKDKVMPKIGFKRTCGYQCLQAKNAFNFGWGLEDNAFFEGSLAYIQQLQHQQTPWMLTLLTVGTHQPYGAPTAYRERYGDAKLASVAYADMAVTRFLKALKTRGVLKDTLVIVMSDESHGADLRLASAWGLSLVFAPDPLPTLKQGSYGHVDLATSVLDYFNLPPTGVMGRSQFRDYSQGRSLFSYTNGLLRYLSDDNQFYECQFQSGCRVNPQTGFIQPDGGLEPTNTDPETSARVRALAAVFNASLAIDDEFTFHFADGDIHKLRPGARSPWADNLIGAQYLEFAKDTRTQVNIDLKLIEGNSNGVKFELQLKEFDQPSAEIPPLIGTLLPGEQRHIAFEIDNSKPRRAFSFHLLGDGEGRVQIDRFEVKTYRR